MSEQPTETKKPKRQRQTIGEIRKEYEERLRLAQFGAAIQIIETFDRGTSTGYLVALADLGASDSLIARLRKQPDLSVRREMLALYQDTCSAYEGATEKAKAVAPPAVPVPRDHASLTYDEQGFIRTNHKLEAIKSVRNRTGLGLKESKDLCDVWQDKFAPETKSIPWTR